MSLANWGAPVGNFIPRGIVSELSEKRCTNKWAIIARRESSIFLNRLVLESVSTDGT